MDDSGEPAADALDIAVTRDSYNGIAPLYDELLRDALDSAPYDRAWLRVFAELITSGGGGPVADAGCGPGRLTGHLRDLGLNIFGIDLAPEMIAIARQRHPDIPFLLGTIETLPLAAESLAGVLAWYSTIHLPPQRLPAVLSEFFRVLRPGGQLMLASQAADAPHQIQPFDHKVAPAYRYSTSHLANMLASIGFDVTAEMTRGIDAAAGERFPNAYLNAVKPH